MVFAGTFPSVFARRFRCSSLGLRTIRCTTRRMANTDLKDAFPSPFDYHGNFEPMTMRMQTLNSIASAIRDKKHWSQKIADATISAKWFQEADEQAAANEWVEELPDPNAPVDPDADEFDDDRPMVDVRVRVPSNDIRDVLSTLQDWAASNPGPVSLGAVVGTYVADDHVPSTLHDALVSGVSALENTPFPDWHPGSDEQVLDLVHPSLYCLVYGVSRRVPHQAPYTSDRFLVKPAPEEGTVIQVRPLKDRKWFSSKKFQWLPSDFAIDQSGKVTIESYINNLHPHKHSQLYHTIADIFGLFVPLFNRVLTQMRVRADAVQIVPPPPLAEHVVDLKGRRVQVIVKLANIHLTPGSPSYPGGSWHVEGMEDENIVASGIYYYSQDNITDSSLAFRTDIRDPDYEQNDDRGVMNKYGMGNEDPLNQVLGRVTTLPGRCLCFPNIYQHQVQPFQLADPSRPGHRKILVFFLVNPATRITSTADVPPQRLDWLLEHELDSLFIDKGTRFYSLPMQAKEMLIRHLEDQPQAEDAPPPFTLARAKLYREQLMEERREGVKMQNEEIFEVPFSLCEH